MNTKTVIVILVIIAIGFFVWKGSMKKEEVIVTPAEQLDKDTQDDTTSSIEADLNAIDVDTNSDSDFMETDSEIKSL
ncbi:MAG: hypothetical protein KBC11_00095 [Candidatus Pacebacteria bacterium]|nr:hypothetical protein [Candidatus Paceibacterota bacterium]